MTGYYAFLDDENIVSELFVVLDDLEFIEGMKSEDFYAIQRNSKCKKTCDTGCFRKNMAAIGYKYDEQRDAFIPPKKFDSWILNEDTCRWEAPIPYPTDGLYYDWDEQQMQWVLRHG